MRKIDWKMICLVIGGLIFTFSMYSACTKEEEVIRSGGIRKDSIMYFSINDTDTIPVSSRQFEYEDILSDTINYKLLPGEPVIQRVVITGMQERKESIIYMSIYRRTPRPASGGGGNPNMPSIKPVEDN